ncbi:spermidine synthase [Propionibacteriaceae bacterium Y1685]|uniref:spermidine synthase n=1 Tax=Microlunatus sp. Y1700 TaxID=3418487 RepID=UPI003B7FDEB7
MSVDDQGPARLLRDAEVDGAWTVLTNGTEQSWIDPDDPTRLEYDYVQRIADALDAHAPTGERLRVIHVGGAGMTLARYVCATRPSSAQIVLEPDAELTQQVREKVPLPRNSGIKVRPVDGRSGIAAMREDFADVIIIDAFAGPYVPAELTTVEFHADVRRVLTSSGTVMINITDKHPFGYARRVVAGVAEVFGDVILSAESATLKGRRFGNLIILGGKAPLPYRQLSSSAAGGAFPYRLITGEHLTKFLAGARPFTDGDSSASPGPPGGKAFFG